MRRRGYDDFCVLLINGLSGSGKTTFEDMVKDLAVEYDIEACKYSVVEPIKSCLTENPVIGCNEHDERTREFIANCYESDKLYYLRLLTERIIMAADDPMGEYSCKKLLLVDMREYQDILKIMNVCRNLRIQCYKVWVDRPGRVDDILDCDNFTYPQVDVDLAAWRKANEPLWYYNIIVENDSSLKNLSMLAEKLLTCFDEGTLKDISYLSCLWSICDEEPSIYIDEFVVDEEKEPAVDPENKVFRWQHVSCDEEAEEAIDTKVLNWYDEEETEDDTFKPRTFIDPKEIDEEKSCGDDKLRSSRLREYKEGDKFKPGDKVIVREPDSPLYSGGWVSGMKQCVGKVYTVSGYFKNYDHHLMLDSERWIFNDRYLELVTEEEEDDEDPDKLKWCIEKVFNAFKLREPREGDMFKPGDKVIVRKPDNSKKYAGGWVTAMNQYVGKVYTVSGYFKDKDHEVMLEDEIWSFDDHYLDLVTDDNIDTSDSESVSVSLCEIAENLSNFFANVFAPDDDEEE